MEVQFAAVSAYDDNHHIISIKADENETIHVGQVISIELQDETFVECTISAMRKWKKNPNAKGGKWIDVESISNGESCEIDIYGNIEHIQTSSMPSAAERKRLANMINLMPYKEINGGKKVYMIMWMKISEYQKKCFYIYKPRNHIWYLWAFISIRLRI